MIRFGLPGGDMSESVYGRIWQAALTPAEAAPPLARRPCDLRHACLSTWLNGGVDPTQVAEWADNRAAVLLRVYARCIAGRDKIARRPGPSMAVGLACSRRLWSASDSRLIRARPAGLASTGLAAPRGKPSGQNGTKAIPRRMHSARTGVEPRSARWNRFCTQTISVLSAACRICSRLTLLRPSASRWPGSAAEPG